MFKQMTDPVERFKLRKKKERQQRQEKKKSDYGM